MIVKNQPITFWLTNISNRNVSLADLNLTIKAFSSINLMDNRHYSYTIEQLKKSAESGSIYKKRDKVVVRKVPPEISKKTFIIINRDASIPNKARSLYSIKEERYEELEVIEDQKKSDEKFAAENADIASLDEQKQIITKE